MKTRKLPAKLEDASRAAAYGAEVARGEARLDWTGVESASREALRALFVAAPPGRHEGPLGLSDIPEAVIDRLGSNLMEAMEAASEATPEERAALEAATFESTFTEDVDVGLSVEKARKAAEKARAREAPPAAPRRPVAKSPIELRDELLALVRRDLVGPEGDEPEELEENQLLPRYLLGRLAPRGRALDVEDLEEAAADAAPDDEDGAEEPSPAPARGLRPSSIGVTLCVTGESKALVARASWAVYKRRKIDNEEKKAREESGDDGRGPTHIWDRRYCEAPPLEVPLSEGLIAPQAPHPDFPDVVIRGIARRLEGEWIVSLFLVNEQESLDTPVEEEDEEEPTARASRRNEEAERYLHQAVLEVEGSGEPHALRRRPVLGRRLEDEREERHAALRFRRQIEFAVGHGTAVEVLEPDTEKGHAQGVRTTCFPRYGVRLQASPDPDETEGAAGLVTDMGDLAALEDGKFDEALRPLTRAYEIWIKERRRRLDAGEDGLAGHERAAQEALEDCEAALARIREGIRLLDEDPMAAECFRFANDAMRRQRIRSEVARRVVAGEPPMTTDPPARWRLFQLGFLLMNLTSLASLDHPDRRRGGRADLLWFPTGGGKTEAYLGVAAFAMAMRRRRGPQEGRPGDRGVAVLMRYTLRLLTIQQFQRAATLICACEEIRKEKRSEGDASLGETPFSIGLWVGKKTTPNTTNQSFDAVSVLKGAWRATRSGSPVQLAHCPWCGHAIDPKSQAVEVQKAAGRTRIACGDPTGACPFSFMAPGESPGLPVMTVDEEIYRRLPTLLLATVDKLAQLPWQGASGQLFGRVEKHCPRHGYYGPSIEDASSHKAGKGLPAVNSEGSPYLQPPDLVIQDELHLISGPLGSLVGLYEAAVDELSAWEVDGKEVRPKIIASTATIRRAEDQGRALFARSVHVFPPPGVDADDSFFAHTPEDARDRSYVGICAPGVRQVSVLLRVYAAFLSASQRLAEDYGGGTGATAADPWMTLVGYFNSLRDLGGMRRVVEDRVPSLLWSMPRRGLARRSTPKVEELTSRLESTRIPGVLANLERPVPAERVKGAKGPRPIDVLLATNMISVGVDVNRLGLMVVAGQPRATAEYIQATSRVGRHHPGIVCTVYNWTRPRDLSHYESFSHYHATFYRQVEATSVTPFAPGALDRGLPGVLVGMVRQLGLDLNENGRAQDVTLDHDLVRRATQALLRRAEAATDDAQLARDLEDQIKALMDRWLHRVNTRKAGDQVGYRPVKDGDTRPLLTAPGLGDESPGLACMTSLRDVEPDIPLFFDHRAPREEDLAPTTET